MTKIRIKLGDLEVEAEGEEQFIKEELLGIVSAAAKLHGASPNLRGAGNGLPDRHNSAGRSGDPQSLKLTTSSIAAKLGAKSGSDLVLAASAQLAFVQNKTSFSRKDILAEAKTASAYYNENVAKNLSSYLNSLVKAHKLNEVSVDVYALHATAVTDLESKVAS